MKSPNEIDKLFKEKLENSGSQEIPASFLDDINKRLDDLDAANVKEDNITKKGRKKGKVTTGTRALLLLVVGISLAVYLLTGNNTAEEKQNNREDLIIDSKNSAENSDSQTDGEKENLPLDVNGNVVTEDEKNLSNSISTTDKTAGTKKDHPIKNEAVNEKLEKGNDTRDKALILELKLRDGLDSKLVKAEKNQYQTDSTTKKVTQKITDENGDSTTTTVITTVITTTTKKKVAKPDSIANVGEIKDTNAMDSTVVNEQLKKKSQN